MRNKSEASYRLEDLVVPDNSGTTEGLRRLQRVHKKPCSVVPQGFKRNNLHFDVGFVSFGFRPTNHQMPATTAAKRMM